MQLLNKLLFFDKAPAMGTAGAYNGPTFATQPLSQSVDEYGTATFTATSGNADSMQFYKRGVAVGSPSLTGNATYSFAVSDFDNGAEIYCVATKGESATTSNSAVLTVVRYAFKPDGLTQYFKLSETIPVLVGDELSLKFIAEPTVGTYKKFFAEGFGLVLDTGATGLKFRHRGGTGSLDGVYFDNEAKVIPTSGKHSLGYYANYQDVINAIGASENGSNPINFQLYEFEMKRGGVTLHKIALNNKYSGAFQYDPAFISENLCTINPQEYFSKDTAYSVFAYMGVDARVGTFLIKFTNNGSSALWYRFGDVANTIEVGETFHKVITFDTTPNARNYIATWGNPWAGVLGDVIFKEITAPMATIVNYNEAGWTQI